MRLIGQISEPENAHRFGDYLISAAGDATLAYDIVLTVEEALEMTGVLIFIVMLLEYIRTFVGTGSFAVTDPLVT